MKRALKWLAALTGAAAILTVGLAVHSWYFRPLGISIFFERAFIQFMLEDPEAVSSLGIFEQLGYKGFAGMLTDVSPAHEQKLAKMARDDLETLRKYDRASLSPANQLSYDILDWFLQDLVEGQRWLFYDYPVNQLFGVQSSTPDFMVQIHPIADRRDVHNYTARLAAFGRKFDQLLEGLRLREAKGIVPPQFVVERVLAEMRAFIAVPARENILYTNLRTKLGRLTTVPAAERSKLLADAQSAIEQSVYPAYRRLIDYFERLQPQVTADYGVWKLPDGDRYYDHLIRSHTTTELDAERVHNIGLAEVARIERELDGILKSQGLPAGTVGERIARLNADSRLQYPNDDAGRAACIADYQHYINEIVRGLGADFAAAPRLDIKVERVPQFKEKTAPGAYADTGSLDGSRPGVFYVNLRDMRDIHKYQMRTLAYHEAVPGHQLQGVIAQRLAGVPTFRKILPGYWSCAPAPRHNSAPRSISASFTTSYWAAAPCRSVSWRNRSMRGSRIGPGSTDQLRSANWCRRCGARSLSRSITRASCSECRKIPTCQRNVLGWTRRHENNNRRDRRGSGVELDESAGRPRRESLRRR